MKRERVISILLYKKTLKEKLRGRRSNIGMGRGLRFINENIEIVSTFTLTLIFK
jgi:hypothetical protein